MKSSIKSILIIVVTIIVFVIGSFLLFKRNQDSISPHDVIPENLPISFTTPATVIPEGDFSCQPNECEQKISEGINNVAYPSCNPKVQINNTGAKNKKACDYWRNQQAYFGTEDYVNLSQLSKEQKQANGEAIVDGFLGIDSDIQVHRKAAVVFLKAEAEFNKKYGKDRQGSTYFTPSYPDGYSFIFNGSIAKRAIRGSVENTDGLLFEGQYITPSNHFWGAAIDLNSENNSGNRLGENNCTFDIPPELVATFEENGLRWGGRFFDDIHVYMDPMHFEVVPECVEPGLLTISK